MVSKKLKNLICHLNPWITSRDYAYAKNHDYVKLKKKKSKKEYMLNTKCMLTGSLIFIWLIRLNEDRSVDIKINFPHCEREKSECCCC